MSDSFWITPLLTAALLAIWLVLREPSSSQPRERDPDVKPISHIETEPTEDDDNAPSVSDFVMRGNSYTTPADLRFEQEYLGFLASVDVIEYAFYVTLAGTSHRNADGTSRTTAIKRCEIGEFLSLVHDSENPFDSNAIAVMNEERQLGFLPAQVAAETVRDMKRGIRHLGILSHTNHHPETDRVVGAVILLVKLRPRPTAPV